MCHSVSTWQKDEWVKKASQALESRERACWPGHTVTAHRSAASRLRAQLLSLFLGLVSLPATTYQLPSPCTLLISWSNWFGLYVYVAICNIVLFSYFVCMYSISPIVFVLILTAEILGSNLTLILTPDSQLKEDFFSLCCNFTLYEFKASFSILEFAFQPKTLAFLRPTVPPSSGSHTASSYLLVWFSVPFLLFGPWGFPLLSCELSCYFVWKNISYPEASDVFVVKGTMFQVI